MKATKHRFWLCALLVCILQGLYYVSSMDSLCRLPFCF